MSRMESVASGWRRAGRCDSHACVEVARLNRQVAVRDSTVPSAVLRFDPASWRDLMSDLREGRLHRN